MPTSFLELRGVGQVAVHWLEIVLGVILGMVSAVTGWVLTHVIQIDKRLAVLEAKPTVDPIEYTKAVTQMAAAVTELTKAIADLRIELKEFRRDFEEALTEIVKVTGEEA